MDCDIVIMIIISYSSHGGLIPCSTTGAPWYARPHRLRPHPKVLPIQLTSLLVQQTTGSQTTSVQQLCTIHSPDSSSYYPECNLLLKDAVQTGDGIRLCKMCFKQFEEYPNRTNPKLKMTIGKKWERSCTVHLYSHIQITAVWRQLTLEQEKKVEMTQNTGMRIILGALRSATGTEMRQKLQWTTLAQRRRLYALKLAHKCIFTCILP